MLKIFALIKVLVFTILQWGIEMNALFSQKLMAFIPENMISDNSYSGVLSNELIKLTDNELSMYWKQNPPIGKTLGAINGRPAWVDLPPLTHEELVSSAESTKRQLKVIANSEIDWRQDAVDGDYAEADEVAELAAWKKYRVLLMRIDVSDAPDIEWPVTPE